MTRNTKAAAVMREIARLVETREPHWLKLLASRYVNPYPKWLGVDRWYLPMDEDDEPLEDEDEDNGEQLDSDELAERIIEGAEEWMRTDPPEIDVMYRLYVTGTLKFDDEVTT
jgi:hypothetical protein